MHFRPQVRLSSRQKLPCAFEGVFYVWIMAKWRRSLISEVQSWWQLFDPMVSGCLRIDICKVSVSNLASAVSLGSLITPISWYISFWLKLVILGLFWAYPTYMCGRGHDACVREDMCSDIQDVTLLVGGILIYIYLYLISPANHHLDGNSVLWRMALYTVSPSTLVGTLLALCGFSVLPVGCQLWLTALSLSLGLPRLSTVSHSRPSLLSSSVDLELLWCKCQGVFGVFSFSPGPH